jgi:hypothetical protein
MKWRWYRSHLKVSTSAMLLVLQFVANVVDDIEVTCVRFDFMNAGWRVQ